MPSIAIIGASSDRSKFGNKAVRAYLTKGWKVYPVNPKGESIEGLKTFKSVLDVPGKVDRVSIYLPPAVGLQTITVVPKKTKVVFLNPGAESPELIEKARKLGLQVNARCSIRDIGEDPADYT